MLIKLDFRSGAPIYFQIVDQVKALIAAGALKDGDQLPTVRQLATDLQVNFNTVARAYRLLDEQGLISTQQGRGTYILRQPASPDQRRLRRERLSDLTGRYLDEAQRLGYGWEEIRKSVDIGLGARRESK